MTAETDPRQNRPNPILKKHLAADILSSCATLQNLQKNQDEREVSHENLPAGRRRIAIAGLPPQQSYHTSSAKLTFTPTDPFQ
jgi:hypothetical protein